MRDELLVVGASFAGCAAAIAAAGRGARVTLIDRKADAGEKLHTTGILVREAVEQHALLSRIPQPLVRRIDTVRLYAPNLRALVLRSPGYYFLATDTPELMRWLLREAQRCGVEVRLGTAFTQLAPAADALEVAGVGRYAYVIGADGPQSREARSAGLGRNRCFLYGVEHELEGVRLPDANALHCFLTRRHAPGYIGWALQGVQAVQFGAAARHAPGAAPQLAALAAHLRPVLDLDGAQRLSVRAGLIPCGGPVAPLAGERVLLVGDAAGLVSPLTAGGIHTAWRHAWEAGEAVADFLHGRAADPRASAALARYPRFRRKRLLRWLFDRLQSDALFDALIGTAVLRRAAERLYFHRATR
jgi:flavin-dependent dehydrogenase